VLFRRSGPLTPDCENFISDGYKALRPWECLSHSGLSLLVVWGARQLRMVRHASLHMISIKNLESQESLVYFL
jgi:hypothetical protein